MNGKTVAINRPTNKLYPSELMKQISADVQPKFINDAKICQIEIA